MWHMVVISEPRLYKSWNNFSNVSSLQKCSWRDRLDIFCVRFRTLYSVSLRESPDASARYVWPRGSPSRFDLSCSSSLPFICTNDLAEIRYHLYDRILLFSAKWARELQLSSEQQSDFELELLELPSAPTQQPAPLSSPLICFLLFPVHFFFTTSSFLHCSPLFFSIFLSPFFFTYLFFLFISFSFPLIFPLPLLSFCPPPDHFPLAIAQCLITAQRTFAANCWWLYKRLSGTF